MREPSKLQKNAIIHLTGPAEVIAGPGSGKTFTIIQRILYLVYQCGISPHKILVITYTKAAAAEMKNRYIQAVAEFSHSVQAVTRGKAACESVHFGTFHSVCWHILRQSVPGQLSLIGEKEKRELVQNLLLNRGVGKNHLYDTTSLVLNVISREKNLSENKGAEEKICAAEAELGEITYEDYLKIKAGYEQYLREEGKVDFDDMITECLKLFMNQPEVLKKFQQQFEYILADEFQDINFPQYQIVKLLAAPENNLFVVGDDDQAIYGFRGASPGIMKQFLEDYPKGKQMLLTENYRSGKEIVSLAEKVIKQNKERFMKEFIPIRKGGKVLVCCFDGRKQEEEALAADLKKLSDAELSEAAVIVRTNLDAVQYAELLLQSGVKVKGRQEEGTDLVHSFIFKDLSAFLSFIYLGNKRSDLIVFMNKPNRFLFREALLDEKVTLFQLQRYYKNNGELLKKLESFWQQLMLAGSLQTSLAVSLFRNTLGYDKYLMEKAQDTGQEAVFLRKADQIQKYFRDYLPGTNLQQYVAQKGKNLGEKDRQTITKEGVSILTMHSAKGLEFDRVWLPDVNEGIIPAKKCITEAAIEEERRLLYVAITRARHELTIYYTKERGRKLSSYLEGIIPRQ